MSQELEQFHPAATSRERPVLATAPLSSGFVLTERAVAVLRAHLDAAGLQRYAIFYCDDLDLEDLEEHLAALGEATAPPREHPAGPGEAPWQRLPALSVSVPDNDNNDDNDQKQSDRPLACLTHDRKRAYWWDAGCLHLRRHQVVIARWYWAHPEAARGSIFRQLRLCAAPSAAHYFQLHQDLLRCRNCTERPIWRVVAGGAWADMRVPRPQQPNAAADELVFSAELRRNIETDVLEFFSDKVADLYRALAVPYRRGVLLHGPPGNGKTSLIRWIGASLPRVSAFLLRPYAGFDGDDLRESVRRWVHAAPALLAIEDLDWLIEQVNVSTFLNLIDGLDQMSSAPADASATGAAARASGLLLIATTNHPEQLDPAINNRPGRFDVAIAIDHPDASLRRRYFAGRVPALPATTHDALAAATEGLSFSHLAEVLRQAGLLAIHADRAILTHDDLLAAADRVRSGHENALRGFPKKPELPFGLAHLRKPSRSI